VFLFLFLIFACVLAEAFQDVGADPSLSRKIKRIVISMKKHHVWHRPLHSWANWLAAGRPTVPDTIVKISQSVRSGLRNP